ncbi:MAG: CoA transferase [Pseudomonadota bacterium]
MTKAALPLAGVRVLDLSRVLAGPYCSLVLADMGADIIKIESMTTGDDSRTFLVPSVEGHSVYFMHVNRNKRSVAIDLKAPAGKDAFRRLVAKSDIVLENFRTGVMERLDLGYEELKQIKPDLVYCAISGYGRSGPNVHVPGYDPVAQAESGFMAMNGEPDGEAQRTGPSIVDMVCGLFAAQSITAALRHAERTGEGRFIEASLYETGMNMLINFAGSYLVTGQEATRAGNTNQVAQPAGVYQASDGPFMLSVITDAQFTKLCRDVIERPDLLEDARFTSNPLRVENMSALKQALGEVFAARTREDWVTRLRAADVPVGSVATIAEALTSDITKARDVVQQVSHSGIGSYPALMGPVRLHDSEPTPLKGSPLLGEHTHEVLRDVAGMDPASITSLEEAGAIKSAVIKSAT